MGEAQHGHQAGNASGNGHWTRSADWIERFSQDLLALGLRPGGVLLVHSSLKALGVVPGGPEDVIQGLLAGLGPAGSLLMPALSYEDVSFKHPIFDLHHTPACVGAIPEYFRTRAGTRRSLHPTHSVCGVGPRSAELLDAHAQDRTPCGPNSPFSRLAQVGGQILMLGCGLRPNTSLHAIEELVEPPYLFAAPLRYTLIDDQGQVTEKEYLRHNFAGWEQRYERITGLLAEPDLRQGPIRVATAYLIEAQALRQAAWLALQQDPYFFVEAFQ